MGDFHRYAVYFAPRPESELGRFGAAWLGWDAERGVDCAGLELEGLPRPRAELVATPRKYGFHATLKAPFRLAAGTTFAELDLAVRDIAANHRSFDVPLELCDLHQFLALIPDDEVDDLDEIEEDCVTLLDRFRAPLSPEEIAKRLAGGLSRDQEENLRRWGYPFVLEEFHFHMTLSGALSDDVQMRAGDVLEAVLAPMLEEPMPFEDLCIFGEASDGRFHVLRRHPLGAAAAGP